MRAHPRGHGRIGIYGAAALATGCALAFVSCGGSGGGDEAPPAKASTLDAAGAQKGAETVKALMPICTPGTGGAAAAKASPDLLKRVLALRDGYLQRAPGPSKRALALTSTPPPDTLGSCGGRMGYADYSHVNGVTTAKLAYTDYCTLNSTTGNKQTLNGRISFVNTATPAPTGPITTKLEASSEIGIVAVSVDGAGKTIARETVTFTGFSMAVGVPGGSPTAANPDRLLLTDVKFTDASNVTYRQSNLVATEFDTATGGTQMTVSGRGYRSGGEFFDYATSTPIVTDAAGDYVGGAVRFSGAGSSTVVVTLVPGPTMQATMTVNGTPVTSGPACK